MPSDVAELPSQSDCPEGDPLLVPHPREGVPLHLAVPFPSPYPIPADRTHLSYHAKRLYAMQGCHPRWTAGLIRNRCKPVSLFWVC